MRLTLPLYLHQFMLINVNIVPAQLFVVIAIYVKYMVVTMLVPLVNLLVKTVCKLARIVSCNKAVIFYPVCKSRHAGNISLQC